MNIRVSRVSSLIVLQLFSLASLASAGEDSRSRHEYGSNQSRPSGIYALRAMQEREKMASNLIESENSLNQLFDKNLMTLRSQQQQRGARAGEEQEEVHASPLPHAGKPISGGPSKPPAVTPISATPDVDPGTTGHQVFQDTTATYAATASDTNITWAWSYRVDGGTSVLYSQGSGAIQNAVYNYSSSNVPAIYDWVLTVTNGRKKTTQTFRTTVIDAVTPRPDRPFVYLDFNGDYAASWGSWTNINTPAYDQDGDTSSFSAGELASISEIFKRVYEKFSPFNLDVFTSFDFETEPTTFNNLESVHVIIGGNGSWYGSAGGVGYVGGFSNSASNSVYVFEDMLANGNAKYVSEASTHEVGHAFGLRHHSTYNSNGVLTAEYDQGNSLVAPIMGNSYYAQRGLWANAPSTSATTYQDDLAVITSATNGFGYRADDHGGSIAVASAFTAFGTSLTSNGIVEKSTDSDYFAFTTIAGTVSFQVSVAQYGAMLDARAEIRDANDNLIAVADTSTLGETLTLNLAAGNYYLVVRSHGTYGDIGQYTVIGTLPA